MVFADVLAIFLLVLAILLALPSLCLLMKGLYPGIVRLAAQDLEKSLWQPFWVGLPIVAVTIMLFGVLAKAGNIAGLAAIFMLGIFLLYSLVGVAGLAERVGRQLFGTELNAGDSLVALRGAIVLVLSFVLPVVGWFILLPVTLTVGAGAITRAILRQLGSAKPQPAPPPSLVSAQMGAELVTEHTGTDSSASPASTAGVCGAKDGVKSP